VVWGVATVLYAWVVTMLWRLDPAGWLYLVLISAFNLIIVLVSVIGQSTADAFVPTIVINGAGLIYSLLPGTRRAFGPPIAV